MAKKTKKQNTTSKGKGKTKKQTKNKRSPVVKKTNTINSIKSLRIQKTRAVPKHIDLSKESEDFKHIVRICNRDIPGYLSIGKGLNYVYGLSRRLSKVIELIFNKKTGKDIKKIGYLSDEDVKELDKLIKNLDKEVPSWLLNRSKQRDGTKAHLIMADLQLSMRKELQRLGMIKSYRGLRLQWGLPVRGQRTRSTFRKSSAVGVTKSKVKK